MDETRLIGRQRELALAGTSIEKARAGHGAILLAAGEPGIGKSRLAQAVAEVAGGSGFQVAWGRCWEGDGAPPWWPWTQIFRELGTPRELEPIVSPAAAAPASRQGADAQLALFSLLDLAAQHLLQLASQRPLALFLDDLHAADNSSLELLVLLARQLRGRSLFLMGTYREMEARSDEKKSSLLARVAREGSAARLGRLSREQLAELAESLAPGHFAAPSLDRVFAATDGNPLFTVETIRLLLSRDDSSFDALPLADSVRAAIRDRTHLLSDETLRLLSTASVMRRELSAELLAEVASIPLADIADALEPACQAGLLEVLGPHRWRFSHVIVQETLRAELPARKRRQLHAKAAAALSHRGPGVSLEALAHHALASWPDGGHKDIVEVATRAVSHALSVYAWDTAAALCARALRILSSPDDDGARYELLVMGCQANQRMGRRVAGQKMAVEAAALARSTKDAAKLARAALAYGAEFIVGRVDPTLVSLLQEALAALGETSPALRSRVLARLSSALQPAEDPDGPVALAREAIALARTTGDVDTLADVLFAAVSALADFAPPRERAPLNREFIALALQRGDTVRALRGYTRLIVDLMELGELGEADSALTSLEALAAQFSHPLHHWRPLLLKAMRALMRGELDEAEALRRKSGELVDSLEDSAFQYYSRANRLASAATALRGTAAEVEKDAAVLTGISDAMGYSHIYSAYALARFGELEQARQRLSRLSMNSSALRVDLNSMMFVADVAYRVGDAALSRLMAERLKPYAGQLNSTGHMAFTWEGPAYAGLGRALAAAGETQEAIRFLEAAQAQLLQCHSPPHLALLQLDLARAHRANAQDPESEAKARALLESAGRIAQSLGMDVLVKLVAEFRQAEAPRAGPPPSVLATPVTRRPFDLLREGDVWLVRGGLSEIRVRHSRGLELLKLLLERAGQEVHVLELLGSDRADGGDAGEALDSTAIASYRERALELKQEMAESERNNDLHRLAKLRAELEAIAEQLSSGVGLRGGRRQSSSVERARVNVQRRLKDAIGRISAQEPELGEYLKWAVKTGTYCSYQGR
jgi:tetratricopeptide (TPR) repeat protein